MAECPTQDQLRLLLESALHGPEQASVENHVDRCAACQLSLEQLTAVPLRVKQADITPNAVTFIARIQAMSLGVDVGPRQASKPAPPPDVPGYDIEGELGRGGMGVVYLARHRRLNRLVALKMLTEGGLSDRGVRTRFLIEAETIAQLRHPHVVQVYEFGEHAGRPYLAMEYVEGGNLAERLSQGHRFTPVEAAELIVWMADAVAAAHAKGIIHRDLKPSNILLATADSKTVPKVADFGIARVSQSEITATGELLGTPSYMAPEQADGRTREVGTATDVYGLGAMLYELLSGHPPFQGETVVETLQQVVHATPRAPRSISRAVPRDLDTICLKCLEKEPKKRYPTADALAADLRAYLDGRTITARPARSWERAVRLANRNPVPFVALLLVAATVVGAFVWVNEARREERRARIGEELARVTAQDNEKEAILARNLVEQGAARTVFDQAMSLCETGNVASGLTEFARVLELAERAADLDFAAVVRRNISAWEVHRPREVRRFDPPNATRPVTATLYADEGRLLITGSRRGGPVRVWPVTGTLQDGRAFLELAPPDAKLPGVVSLVPASSTRVYAVYESGHVVEWEPRTGKVIRQDLAFDLPCPIRSAGMTQPTRSVSGKLLCVGYEDGTFRVWDLDRRELFVGPDESPVLTHFYRGPKKKQRFTGLPAKDDPQPPPGPVNAIDFGDSGNMLLTAGETEGVILYGLPVPKTGRVPDPILADGKVDPRIPYHQFDLGGAVFQMLVSPDRQFFLAGGATAVSLWTIHERDRPVWVHSHPDRITALAFSPDGRLCASADHGGTIRCWDVLSGAFQAQLHFPEPVRSLRFPPTGTNNILLGSQNGSSVLWQLPLRSELEARPAEPTPVGPGVVIRIGSNSEQAVLAGFESLRRGEWVATSHRLLFWPADGSPRFGVKPNEGETIARDSVSVSPDGKVALISVLGRKTFSVCDLTSAKSTAQRIPTAGVTRTGFLSETRFFTVSEELQPGTNELTGQFRLWELTREKGVSQLAAWPLSAVTCVAPHPDGKSVLVGRAGEDRVVFRDAASGKEVGSGFPHMGVTAVAVDPGQRWVATAGQGQSVRVWPLTPGRTGRPLDRTPLHGDRVNALAFGTGPSAGVLATASSDGTARFWDAKTGYPLGPPLRHPEAVLSVAFDASGERVITGSRNGYAKLWPAPKAVTP